MSSEPWAFSATTIIEKIRKKKLSALEVLESHLARIHATNPAINAIVTLSEDTARKEAITMDKRISKGEEVGPLAGVPIGIKDVTATAGIRTTYGSKMFAEHIPDKDDILVQRIKKAGAVIVGKTNTPEFATGGNTYNELFGSTKNPWNPALSAGGSTGGGGAGLIAGMFPLASGSDLGGSLRIPAAFCGVTGIRPTVGLVPAGPKSVPFDTLSVPGPMARTAGDLAILLKVISEPHIGEAHTSGKGYGCREVSSERKLRLAYVLDCAGIGIDEDVAKVSRTGAEYLKRFGHQFEEIELDLSDGRKAFSVLRAQFMVNRYIGLLDRLDELGENLSGNIRLGLGQKPSDIAEAEAIRTQLWMKLVKVFKTFDAVLTPTLPITSFPVEQNYPQTINGRKMESYIDWFSPTFVFSLFGVPALSVPAGLTKKQLPVGLQIVGPRFSEDLLIGLAAQVEKANPMGFPEISQRV